MNSFPEILSAKPSFHVVVQLPKKFRLHPKGFENCWMHFLNLRARLQRYLYSVGFGSARCSPFDGRMSFSIRN